MKIVEELLDFYLTANNETRKNVTGLIKEAISSSVRVADNSLVIGILGKPLISRAPETKTLSNPLLLSNTNEVKRKSLVVMLKTS